MKIAVSPQHKGRAITVCELCGTRFLSWIIRDRRYCSRDCYRQALQLGVHQTTLIDLTGQHLGRWIVRERDWSKPPPVAHWICVCACGTVASVRASDLRSGKSRSCGCLKDEATSARSVKDLTGRVFERLTVIERAASRAYGKAYWLCRCACGTEVSVQGTLLLSGDTRSCGCLKRDLTSSRGRIDLRGQRFGRWLVLDEEPQPRSFASGTVLYWRCQCDCGTVRSLRGGGLAGGHTKSCGCLKAEATRERATTHGKSKTAEHRTWLNIIQRCHNASTPAYRWYGARGIAVCPSWRASFATFLADMGPRPSAQHTIERVDNDRGYEPGNCTWADLMTQGSNTRKNRHITFDGKTLTLSQWSRLTGISISQIHKRLMYYGWSVEDALTIPKASRWDER